MPYLRYTALFYVNLLGREFVFRLIKTMGLPQVLPVTALPARTHNQTRFEPTRPEFSGLFRRKKNDPPPVVIPVETAEGPDGVCIENDDAVDNRAARIYCYQGFNLTQPGFSEQLLQPFDQVVDAAKRLKLSERIVADCQKGLFKLTQSKASVLKNHANLFDGGPTEARPDLPWIFPLSDCNITGELDAFKTPNHPMRRFQYSKRGSEHSLTFTLRAFDKSNPGQYKDIQWGFASKIKANPRDCCQTDFIINTVLAYSKLNHYLAQEIAGNRIMIKLGKPVLPVPLIMDKGTLSTGPK